MSHDPNPNRPPLDLLAPRTERPDFTQRYHEVLGELVRLTDRSARWCHAQLHGALEGLVDRALRSGENPRREPAAMARDSDNGLDR